MTNITQERIDEIIKRSNKKVAERKQKQNNANAKLKYFSKNPYINSHDVAKILDMKHEDLLEMHKQETLCAPTSTMIERKLMYKPKDVKDFIYGDRWICRNNYRPILNKTHKIMDAMEDLRRSQKAIADNAKDIRNAIDRGANKGLIEILLTSLQAHARDTLFWIDRTEETILED